MKQWDVDIAVDLKGGTAALCHATLFADTAGQARRDGRALLETVYRSGEGKVTAVRVNPSPLARPLTITRVDRR